MSKETTEEVVTSKSDSPAADRHTEIEKQLLHDEEKIKALHDDYRDKMGKTAPSDMRGEIANHVIDTVDKLRKYIDNRFTFIVEDMRNDAANTPYTPHGEREMLLRLLVNAIEGTQRICNDLPRHATSQYRAANETVDEFYPKSASEKITSGILALPNLGLKIMTLGKLSLKKDVNKVK